MMRTVPVIALVLVTGLMLCLPVHLDATTVAPSERLGNAESTSNTVVKIMSASPPGEWTEMHPASAPSPRTVNWMAYDSVSDKVILFGGRISYYGCYNETWAYDFDTDTWTNMTQPVAPSSRFAHAMAYDSQSNRVILFGGSNQLEQFSDTWAFNYEQNEWTNMNPIVAPSPRADFGMVYDSQSDRVILFGGYAGYDIDETWSYDFETNSWTNMNPTPRPPARFTMAIAYDIQSDRVLIFGGAGGGLRDDMWAYDFEGNTWTEMHPAVRPPPSYGTRFSYDSHADRTVMFGGDNPDPPYYYNDTWTYDFDANVWTKIDVYPRPFGRGYQGMAYDSRSARSIIFGGAEGNPTVLFNDTWAFLELAAHDPILIDGNAEFTDANGVVAGSGTESDPYVIVGWDIEPPYGVTCIDVRNADAHFVVQDCYLHGSQSASGGSGIDLLKCSNATIERCTSFDNDQGILVRQSHGVVVRDCYCYNNSRGISLSGSELCLATGNTCSDGNGYGIYIEDWSSNNSVVANNCSYNHNTGISMAQCWNNTVSGNACNFSDRGFELTNAHDNRISGNLCHFNAEEGICSFDSDNNTFEYNHCSDNTQDGIRLSRSNNSIMDSNNCSSNAYWGIRLQSSNNATLSSNNCSSNAYDGIMIEASSNNTLVSNRGFWNFYNGIDVVSSRDNILISNIWSSNGYDGAYIGYSIDTTLDSNNCSSNSRWGIQVGYSSGTVMLRNQLCYNLQYGMCIWSGSSFNFAFNNTFIGNNGAGSAYDPSHVQAIDDGPNNWWNSTDGYGNHWSDWTTPDVAPPDGIVDIPYDIGGSAGAKDYYPQTTPQAPIPEFGTIPLVVIGFVILLAMIMVTRQRNRLSQ
jgi:parallel beta-helix repeat protein